MKTFTFTDVVEKKVGEFYSELKQNPQLVGYITNGFPIAISSYLAKDLYENSKTESDLIIECPTGKVMRFSLKATKKGDSVAFMPEFELLDAGKEFINSDEVNFDSDTIENFARDIVKNNEFMKCLKEAFSGKIFVDGEFIDIATVAGDGKKALFDENQGLVYDDENDVAISAYAVIVSILEILCNNKDASAGITYEVPGLGIFKVDPIKDGYSVNLTFDKEFKSNCKSDKLAEKIADLITE